jgi:uncharacterized glyoxalase superfamily protein PhnB
VVRAARLRWQDGEVVSLVPWLMYADAGGAIEFLCRAFGFEERSRYAGSDGKVVHAELVYDKDLLWLASPTPDTGFGDSPMNLPAEPRA